MSKQFDLEKKYFSPQETEFILDKLQRASEAGFITRRSENNPFLLASFRGTAGSGISPKWNLKIYTYNKKKKGHSLVCVDKHVLGKLLNEDYDNFTPPDLQVLRIDDAGWGFPLCGVMNAMSKQFDLQKKHFSPQETEFILDKLQRASEAGFVTRRSENTPYLLASFRGVKGSGISPKWNLKIYTFNKKKKGHSLVCVDKHVLGKLLDEDYDSFIPPDLQVLRIDDAGWGFPLCGVMVGVSDEHEVRTAVVPIEYFRDDTKYHFSTKLYLKVYADLAVQILDRFEADPETHRIEICTGYVNQPLREQLRKLGYDVRVVEIKGMLQNELERRYKVYVLEEVGFDIYYDPKDMSVSDIPRRYRETLKFGQEHCPDKIKTGWKAISGSAHKG